MNKSQYDQTMFDLSFIIKSQQNQRAIKDDCINEYNFE